MPRIIVHTAFKLLGVDGKHIDFPIGAYDVPQEIAGHWYVKAHAEDITQVEEPVKAEAEVPAEDEVTDPEEAEAEAAPTPQGKDFGKKKR